MKVPVNLMYRLKFLDYNQQYIQQLTCVQHIIHNHTDIKIYNLVSSFTKIKLATWE